MSEKKRKKRSGDAADQQQTEAQEALECRRDKLLADISALRLLLSKAEAMNNATRFGDIVIPEKLFPKPSVVPCPPDPQIALRTELHALAGVRAKKLDDGFVFGFGRGGTRDRAPSHWIQLCSESGEEWRVGRWVLPMSVDVAALLREYPVDSPLGIKQFLRECKRRVDCYQRRKQQCSQLEIFIAELNLQNCSVQPDTGFTRVSLKLAIHGVVRNRTNAGRSIVVDLCYKSNETRPTRMIVESDEPNFPLNDEEVRKTRALLKAFKEHDLREAAVRIFTSEDNESVWKRAPRDDLCNVPAEHEEEEDEMDTSPAHGKRGASRSRKRRKRPVESDRETENESDTFDVAPDAEDSPSEVPSRAPASANKRRKPANDVPTGRTRSRVKKSATVPKKSAKPKKIGKNRQLEDEAETKENRRRVNAGEKSAKKSSPGGQAKLSRYFSPGQNRRNSSPEKSSNDRVAGARGGVASGKMTKNPLPCSTPIVGRVAKLHLDDDISEIVRVLDKGDHKDDDDEESTEARRPPEIANQTELLRDVRAVHFAIDHVEKPPKRNKAPGGARRKSAIKKK